jgi:Domain of unknown function (DUF4281)
MTADQIFQYSNTFALLGWIILIFFPFWKQSDKVIIAIVYAWLVLSTFKPADIESFSTLDGVMKLFDDRTMVVGGWVHYLAFDLMTGLFIRKNAALHGINHWLTVPCLFFTFMLGPVGLLLYFLLRWIITRQYFADNYA